MYGYTKFYGVPAIVGAFIGIIAFVLQEIPYIIMALIKPASNSIMNMKNEIQWIVEK